LGLVTYGVSRVPVTAAGRALAERTAASIAAYLALTTPRPLHGVGPGYDLPRLLIRARGLESLPRSVARFEVYHGTAPLVAATARPLAPSELAALRDTPVVSWSHGVAVAPLEDDGTVVGAVAVARPRLAAERWGGLGLWGLVLALALAYAASRPRAPKTRLGWYALAGLALGVTSYVDVRRAAREATDRWVLDTAVLIGDAARLAHTRAPDRLAPLAAGARLARADSPAAAREDGLTRSHDTVRVAVRLGPGRRYVLSAQDAGPGTAAWLFLLLACGFAGPLTLGAAAARSEPSPS